MIVPVAATAGMISAHSSKCKDDIDESGENVFWPIGPRPFPSRKWNGASLLSEKLIMKICWKGSVAIRRRIIFSKPSFVAKSNWPT
jgi:hypothetical protein